MDSLNCRWSAVCSLARRCWKDSGFVDVQIGPAVDTFKGAGGEEKARKFAVYGYPFMARKPA